MTVVCQKPRVGEDSNGLSVSRWSGLQCGKGPWAVGYSLTLPPSFRPRRTGLPSVVTSGEAKGLRKTPVTSDNYPTWGRTEETCENGEGEEKTSTTRVPVGDYL